MNGVHLRIYTYENRRHGGLPMYEWLLREAKASGIHGGSAFRALAGFGRHGTLHEEHFFELAGSEPVLVEFIAEREQVDALIAKLRAEKVEVFYAEIDSRFGTTAPVSA